MSDIEMLQAAIQSQWPGAPGEKAGRYIGQFTDRTRRGTRIVAKVVGNHDTYTVSIQWEWVTASGGRGERLAM